MRTTQEISHSIRARIYNAMQSASHLKNWGLNEIDINVTAEPGEPELYKERGCSGAEMLSLLDELDSLHASFTTSNNNEEVLA